MAQGISIQQATALAKSGDSEAQYALSSVLHQRGQFDESLKWLRLAAAQKLVPAQITLATMLMDGRQCPRDRQQALAILEPLARSHIQANLLLSELHGFAACGGTDRVAALRFLAGAGRMGDGGALRQLALLSVCHQRWRLVRPLLHEAARRGDAPAIYALAYCYAEGLGGEQDPARAAALCAGEAARSQYLVQALAQRLGINKPGAAASQPAELNVDWPLVEQELVHLAQDIPLPAAEVLRAVPLIRKLPGVVHPLVLNSVINAAAPLVQRSKIVDARTGVARIDPMRNSSHVTFGPRQHDHVLESLERCISRVTELPVLNGEFLQILRYRLGEEFRPHVDYFNESGAGAYQSLADGGQRAQTVLMYLNDGYAGGSTCFLNLSIEVKGRPGDMLHFHNLDAKGIGDRDTLHAGMPVTAGEKWLLSQWIRSENYPARITW